MAKEQREKQKILMVNNFYQIGGGEHTVFENEQKLLRKNGHEVITYIRHNTEISQSIVEKFLLPVTTVFSYRTYRDIKRLIVQNNIEIVHCHNTFPLISPSVYYAAWKYRVPVIQTIHNFRFICPNGVFFRNGQTCEECRTNGLGCAIRHCCYRNSRIQTLVLVNMLRFHRAIGTYKKLQYIFLTDFNREKFKELLGETLNQQFIKPNFEYINIPQGDFHRDESYIFVGRLDENKGVDFLINNWDVEKELYIFGNGALEEYVRRACDKNPKIHYLGFQTKEIIWNYMGKATAMLFPTDLYEGFPMTIIEAFAVGTPVVCTDIGNGADIVNRENAGVTFKRRDKNSFMTAIREVEKNFDKYSRNARTAYKNHYTPEDNYDQLMNIYRVVEEREKRKS